MTCREKLKAEHPLMVGDYNIAGCAGCPSEYGYLPDPDWCGDGPIETGCGRCWNREIPGGDILKNQSKCANTCNTCIHHEICKFEGQYATLMDSLKDCQFIRPERIMCVYYKPSYKKEV